MAKAYPTTIACQVCNQGAAERHCEKSAQCNWYLCPTCDHLTAMTRQRLGQVILRSRRWRPFVEPKD